jgi:hypothetical protein
VSVAALLLLRVVLLVRRARVLHVAVARMVSRVLLVLPLRVAAAATSVVTAALLQSRQSVRSSRCTVSAGAQCQQAHGGTRTQDDGLQCRTAATPGVALARSH